MAKNLQSAAATSPASPAWRIWVLGFCFILPVLVFGLAGGLWFYERAWLGWAGGAFFIGEAMALVLFRRWAKADQPLLPQPSTKPPEHFSPRDEQAWRLIVAYQERIERGEIVFTSLEEYVGLGREILERIARFYRPNDPKPLIAVQIPLLFRALEETTHDLAVVTTSLPFAHRVTISDIVRGYRLGQKLKPAYELYQVYRILSPLVNWQSAILRFFVTERLFDLTKETLQQWLLRWYVDRVGYHAIALYSGKLLLTQRPEELRVGPPQAETSEERQVEPQLTATEPLRILLLGQVKAGKSSLVNALFGEVRATVDVVPTSGNLTPYVFKRVDGEDAIVLFDMAGYDDPTVSKERIDTVLDEALRADGILLVSSAVNAAREPDRRVLQAIRDYFGSHPELHPPPILVALTHIDQLRPPLVWEPPYNIATPDTPKARSIRAALDAVASGLGLAPTQVIPVCVHPERLYNIEQALMPALVHIVPEAKRTMLLRGLKLLREQEQWTILGRQAQATGRFLLDVGGEVLQKVVGKVRYETRQ